MTFTPTDEQACAMDLFATGENLAVEAGAGTGKTSTLQLMAASTTRRGQYVAFNRAIVDEADRKMPSNVSARTIHSLAFRATGKDYAHRLDSPRMTSAQIARILSIDPFTVTYGSQRKVLQPGQLAGMVMRALDEFCKSADPEPTRQHFAYVDGIDLPAADGRRTYGNNNALQALLEPKLRQAWADALDINGRLRYSPARYLKQWQLNDPTIACDFLLFDEAQDVSEVMLAIVEAQATRTQLVFVGDSQQCQPTGTMVTVVDTVGHRKAPSVWHDEPIENIKIGDRVVSFGMAKSFLKRRGSVVTDVAARPYSGNLVDVEVAGHRSSYTGNHRCVVRVDAAFRGKYLVYLMRRGNDYRIGKTTGSYQTQDGQFGLPMRMAAEGADAGWVLSQHDTDVEALEAEQIAAWTYGVPTLTFKAVNPLHQDRLDRVWAKVGSNATNAELALRAHGRLIEHPLCNAGDTLWRRRCRTVAACNLVDGMMMLPIEGAMDAEGKQVPSKRWAPITVSHRHYEGTVHSLAVADDETYVADGVVTHNSIYGWNGAVDAMSKLPDGFRSFLTQSFRFGPEVAAVANTVLTDLEADLRIKGLPSLRSTVGKIADGVRPDAVLCRTNAGAVSRCLEAQAAGVSVYLAGGGDQVIKFAEGAADLQAGRSSWHPELSCFTTWGEVQDYVEQDELGGELQLLVDLVDKFTPPAIISGLKQMPDELNAELTVTTAHKSKGREWNIVQLADDFGQQAKPGAPEPEPKDPSDEEKRLLYVAVTRAQKHLDVSQVPYFTGAA